MVRWHLHHSQLLLTSYGDSPAAICTPADPAAQSFPQDQNQPIKHFKQLMGSSCTLVVGIALLWQHLLRLLLLLLLGRTRLMRDQDLTCSGQLSYLGTSWMEEGCCICRLWGATAGENGLSTKQKPRI